MKVFNSLRKFIDANVCFYCQCNILPLSSNQSLRNLFFIGTDECLKLLISLVFFLETMDVPVSCQLSSSTCSELLKENL